MTTQAAKTDRRHVAYHEAGHAVVASLLGYEIMDVTIIPYGRSEGSFRFAKIRLPRADRIKIDLAGAIAKAMVNQRSPFYGASGDWQSIARIARGIARPEEVIEKLQEETETLVQQNAEAIVRVAEALLKCKILSGVKVAMVMRNPAEPPTIFDGFCFEPRLRRRM